MKYATLLYGLLLAACSSAVASTLLVGNKYDGTVSFIDLKSGQEVLRPEAEGSPHEITLSPDGKQAIVVSYLEEGYIGEELNVFDVATAKLLKTIKISPHQAPHGIAWIGDGSSIVVTTEETRDVIKVDIPTGTVTGVAKTDQIGSHLLALSPDHTRAYVTSRGSNTFSVIELEGMKLLKTLPAGEGPEAVNASPDGQEIWIGNNQSKDIYIFDAKTLEQKDKIDTGFLPIRVLFTPDGQQVAVADLNGHRLVIYDAATRQAITEIDLKAAPAEAREPASLLFSADGSKLYVGSQKDAKVVEIDAQTWKPIRTFAAAAGSDGLAISPISMTK